MTVSSEVGVVDFPTIADLIDEWIRHHCRVPDGFARAQPFEMADWQFWCTAQHYRIRPTAKWHPRKPLLNQAFVHRRSQIVAPQKTGKGPWSATVTAVEAVGPALFGGWAKKGDVYDCADHGCSCGFYFRYEPGDPKGIRHPSPLIQLTATSEDQVDNIYRPLAAMIRMGPLGELMAVREGFIRILGQNDDPDVDRIDVVTASANSRLGNPITFAVQDESGLYTDANRMRKVAETQRRGAAGMGGRTMETTNAWDPSENSVAQTTYESQREDIFKFYRQPPRNLSYGNKRERRKIHQYVYEGSWWVDLDSIEAEAAELLEKDAPQAERFFGNRLVAGANAWMDPRQWDRCALTQSVEDGAYIALGFDGSQYDDSTVLRACRMSDGYLFTPRFGRDKRPTIWEKPECAEGNGWEVPRGEVNAAVEEMFSRFRIVRFYADPPYWQSEVDGWYAEHGDVVYRWATARDRAMSEALEQLHTDVVLGEVVHDGDPVIAIHVGNARRDIRRGNAVCIKKDKPQSPRKIDGAMATTLAYKARFDAIREGYEMDEEPAELVSW